MPLDEDLRRKKGMQQRMSYQQGSCWKNLHPWSIPAAQRFLQDLGKLQAQQHTKALTYAETHHCCVAAYTHTVHFCEHNVGANSYHP
jgi:hypothetical protein